MASYGKIYEFVFDSVNGAEVVIVISKKNYTGSSSRRALGRPPVLKKENSGCIFGTSLEIYAECTVDGEYSQLYTSSADEFKVELYRMNQMVWFGFVSPELYSEPQIAPPYDVQIIATDGLGELKNFSFVGQGMVTIDQHLASILQHTGFDLAVDHVSSMTYGDGLKDAFTAYLDLDHLASETCYDVLQLILKTFHATITQYNGRWLIVRECDLATIGGSVSIADFGSKASSDFWPINFLSTVIDPAKKELTINTDAGSKGDILVNGSIDSDAGWDKSSGVEYNRNAKAYVLASQGDEISQRLNFGGTFLSGELTLSVIAQSVGEPEKKKEDGPTMRIQVVIQGKKGEDGEVKTWYLGQYASDETSVRRGMTRYKWSDTEEVIPMALPESSTFPDQDSGTEKYIPIPLSVDRENARTGQIIPGMYASEILVRIYKPYEDERDKYVYQCSLEGISKGKLRYKAYLNNGARDTSEEIDVLLGPVTSSSSPVTDYAVPVDDSGAIIAKWGNGQIASTDFINYIVEDYARSVALPRQIITGILNVPTEQVPVLFRRDNTLYYIRQSSFDLYNDELDIQLVSIPYATVEVGAIEEMQSSGSSGGSGAGGDASSSSFAKLTVDLSMLDARIGDLEDMFFWADDEKTTIGTKYNFYSERQNAAGGVGDEEEGEGIGGGIIDEEMSDDSDNAVANRVIKAYIDALFNDFKDNPSAYIPLKTVNGMVLYGSGDIKIEGGSGEGTSGLTAINVNSQSFQPDNGIVTLPDYRPLEYYNQDLAKKVDKVDGKGLSTNDYTTSEKNKLAGIAAGAEVNVQSDWNATSGDAFIRNKPTLAAVATSGSYADLEDKPVIPPLVTSDTVTSWGFTKNVGTVTGVKMNGVVKGSSGVVDLGTVITSHQDISGKVDKVDGKGLSTNDYTTADKNKLAGIAAGAEVNVQSDWNATSGDAFIRNKPTLAAVATSGSYADLEDKPVIPPVVTSDTVTSWGFIKTANLGALAFKNSLAFSELASHPTTLSGYGIKDAVVNINSSDNPLPTDTQAFTSYCYATRGWKITGPVISFPSGSYKGNIQIGMSSDNPRMFINCIYNGSEGVWTEVLTALNISQYAVKVGGIFADSDLNDYLEAGSYGFWGNIANSAGGSHGVLLVTSSSPKYFTCQLFTNAQGHLYSRAYEGAWRNWRTILDDNNYTSYVYSKTDSDAKYVPFLGNKTIFGNVTFSGTVTSQGTFQTRYFDFFQDGVRSGGMAADASNVETLYFITKNYGYRTIIHSGNIGLFTAGKATQLANARLIWGQRFDGTENITGLATFDNGLTSNGNITLAGTSISSWKDIETNYVAPTYLAKSAYTMPTNSFDAPSGNLGINMMSNALYAADSRFTISGDGFLSFSSQSLFNGNYEDGCYVEKGATATLTISNNGNSIIAGYTYGDIYLSFYYDEIPESVVVEVYCNYASQGIGWHTLDLAGMRGQKINGIGHVWYYHNDYYNVTDLRITITAQSGKRARLTEVDWHLSRASLSNLPIVTKFGIDQTLYGKVTFAAGVKADNLTVTGVTSLNSTLSVSGLTTLNSSLTVSGQATLSGGAFFPPSKTIRFQDAAPETFTISFDSEVGGLNLSGATRTLGLASFQQGIQIEYGQSIAFVDKDGVKQYITLDEENGAIKVIGNFFATGQNAAAGVGEVTGESGGGVANVEIKVNALSAYGGRTITTNAMQTLTGLSVDVAQSMLEGAYNKVIDNSGDYPEVWDYTARGTSTGIIIYLRIGDGYDMNTAYALTYTQSAANWSIIMGEI